ncbi:urease accessory protein UreE [Synechococcus sp. CS-1328]|nr:urease accessory protein UreE [Synechococcus sp. CS-1328]
MLLEQRLGRDPQAAAAAAPLLLPLTAQERTSLRGRRCSACGRALLLQLPRGAALEPGEWLGGPGAARVRVEAAPEPLLQVRAADPLALLQAAYHLGNRHVALEIQPGELRLLQDPVLAHLLEHRGLMLQTIVAPFLPESGAYGHADGHGHVVGQSHVAGHSHFAGHSHADGHRHAPGHSHDG